MILQALNEYYYKLLEEPESGVAPPGYSRVDVSFVLVLSKKGELIDMYQVEKEEMVPEQKKRMGINPIPYFLCDKILYSLGIGKNLDEGIKRFKQYRDFNLKLLEKADCVDARAVMAFLNSWDPSGWMNNPIIMRYEKLFDKPTTYNTVYKIDGQKGFVHQNPQILNAWLQAQEASSDEAVTGQCLITGETGRIARTHNVAIKGVGGQASGTALVSFQKDAFCSYGKSQSYNAPVSEKAAFAYATALNYLIDHDIHRVRLADTTMVFWADCQSGGREEQILSWCIDPLDTDQDEKEIKRILDPETVRQAKTILERARKGLEIGDATLDEGVRCYLLGVAPNAARLSIRFWQVSSFGTVIEKIGIHYRDFDIAGIEKVLPPWLILKATAVQGDSKNIPPLLGGQFLKSVITGQMYPQTLYNAALIRCRAGGEKNGVTSARAAIVKAFLKRKYRFKDMKKEEEMITLSLNEENGNEAYLMGRLFSLLEKVQKDALGDLNASIRDRYFGSASATPASVFPLLLRLSRHHIAKSKYGDLSERKIQEVLNRIDSFPSHFNLDEQGLFILGYYHQNQANYTKNENSESKEGEKV